MIAEGKSYRVRLNPADDDPSGGQVPRRARKRGKAFLLIAVGAAAAMGIAVVGRGTERGTAKSIESPDRP